jgi:glycosyltransferase involved in cell wall biosynthesis
MSIVIFGDSFSFPEGNAATNRVYTYANGFYENGVKVHVICFGNEYLKENEGIANGIFFYHPFGQKRRNNYFLIRRWQKLRKYFKAIRLINKINKDDKIIAFNCWTPLLQTQLFLFILSRYLKTFLILERSEHPLRNFQGSFFKKTRGEFKVFTERVLCDGMFCISQYLIDFYEHLGKSPKKLFLVPGTVDTNRFNIPTNAPFDFQYILYCGSLTILKDGVNILIESFNKITQKHPEIKLVLVGKGDTPKEENMIKALVKELNIEEKVIFTGQLSREKIPAYLNNAKILALARPKSIVADAGFPSKLTEYLATGIPVVVTKVGEIPVYLRDNENAFLSEPDDTKAFAEKLDFVLCNYKLAKEISSKGKELTNTIFNYNYQARRIMDFIYSLN